MANSVSTSLCPSSREHHVEEAASQSTSCSQQTQTPSITGAQQGGFNFRHWGDGNHSAKSTEFVGCSQGQHVGREWHQEARPCCLCLLTGSALGFRPGRRRVSCNLLTQSPDLLSCRKQFLRKEATCGVPVIADASRFLREGVKNSTKFPGFWKTGKATPTL